MRDDSDIFLVYGLEVPFELRLHALPVQVRPLHHFDQSLLVAQQLRTYVYELGFLLFRRFSQNRVLPGVVDSGAVVGSSQVEHGFPDQ